MPKLHEAQSKAASSTKRNTVERAGRRSGKTVLKLDRMLYRGLAKDILLTRVFETRSVIFLAPTQKQARTIIWEALKSRLAGIGKPNEQRLEMNVTNELGGITTIFVGGWENRENYRGMSNVVHIEVDETDTMKDFFLSWNEIFKPMLMETGGTASFSGTPKNENPNLRRLEKEAEGKDDWECFHWSSWDNPYFSREELEKAEIEMDRNTYLQEIMAEYVDNLGALFHYDALVDLFSNTITKTNDKYLTVDIAEDGHDSTVYTRWEGLDAYKIEKYHRQNTDTIINTIKEIAAADRIPYSNIAVDAIGVGAGVASSAFLDGIVGYKSSFSAIKTDIDPVRLPNVHYTNTAPLTTDYKNLRSQCVFELARLVNNHEIAVSHEDARLKTEIIEELATYQDASSGDGKRMATKKEDVKEVLGRSPDVSDTLLMRMYFVVRDRMNPVQSEAVARIIQQQQHNMQRNKLNAKQNSTR